MYSVIEATSVHWIIREVWCESAVVFPTGQTSLGLILEDKLQYITTGASWETNLSLLELESFKCCTYNNVTLVFSDVCLCCCHQPACELSTPSIYELKNVTH